MWIDGFYSNKKSINFKLNARPGDYYLIVMPEWRQVHRHNISVIISSES